MSGHSKWSTIKHKKGALDAKRGKIFSKLAREITVAARMGGGDPQSNIRLRTAILKARSLSLPNKNIENAIKSGTGDKDGANYEEVVYEGYGPEGVAILLECLTDNKNRTVAAVRAILSKNGGNLGESGSVAWQFEKKGLINIERSVIGETELMDVALNLGAEDVEVEDEGYTVVTQMSDFHQIHEKLKEAVPSIANAELAYVAKNEVPLTEEKAQKVERVIGLLDDLDDVQSVASNETIEK